MSSTKHRERGMASKDGSKHVGRTRRGCFPLDDGAQTDEVDEHGLSVAPIGAITWVLGHVGVHNQVVRLRPREPQRLVRTHGTERRPAARGARHVGVDWSIDVRHDRAALWTRGFRHLRLVTRSISEARW
jgi:hypothetical protein